MVPKALKPSQILVNELHDLHSNDAHFVLKIPLMQSALFYRNLPLLSLNSR